MPPNTPEGRIKIIAENLARAALAEMRRDVEGAGTAAGGASTGFEKLVFQQGHLIASTQGARRGLNIVENGLRTLAFQAAGVPGPVGKIASGFGFLGAGSLVVTGVVAGVGAVALGYRMLTRDAREAGEAADKLTDSVKKQTLGGQFRAIGADLTEASRAATPVAAPTAQLALGQELLGLIRGDALEDAGEKAVAAVMAVRDARVQAGKDAIRSMEREAELIGLTTAEAARLKASWMGLTEAETANYIAAATRLERRKEETRALEAQNRALEVQADILAEIGRISREVETFGAFVAPDLAGLKLPDIFADESARQAGLRVAEIEKQGGEFAFGLNQDFFDQVQLDVNNAIASLEKAGGGAKTFGIIAAQSLAFLGAAQQGGAGGILTAGGGLLSGLSELKGLGGLGPIGIVTTALGGVFDFFDRSAERRQREQMEELRRIRENTEKRAQPDHVSVTVSLNGKELSGALVEDVLYAARRLERRDATPRLPSR